jgi:hypothetical protein
VFCLFVLGLNFANLLVMQCQQQVLSNTMNYDQLVFATSERKGDAKYLAGNKASVCVTNYETHSTVLNNEFNLNYI